MAKAQLGVLLNDLRGKAGNAVFQKGKDGLIVRAKVMGTNPNTPAQQLVRAAFTKASQDYSDLTPTQVQGWKNYALNHSHRNRVNGQAYNPNPFNAFTELAAKFYIVSPGGTAPTTPPAGSFAGDSITITATPGTGKVTFTASAANAANVTTEFLVQPLRNANRKPQKNGYRSKGFFAFTSGDLSHDVTVPAGFYAVGYKFVNTATGQETEPFYLPLQQVTLSVSLGSKSSQKKAA